MNTLSDSRIVAHPFRALAITGVLATLAAMAATTVAAALARAAGVTFEVSAGETVPLAGITTVTGFFSLVGVVLAAALLRWSAHPARRFVATTTALTALSLIPPFLAGATAATSFTLVALHLVAAAVMIPALTRSLR
ncbi:DUF6069 family protein [Actinoplanes sp. TRM 88003]|uniref:DUF6069 family protein n=1 Tax=Paractinoplanes aksuensis TaxID=2939490 RepID=A0ABT1DLJ5_9ACTN|nr:DUF6069 family protein [Actinoplanes aksuensis]MCO8271713.1 DUF6069 family protein [Actinoplanes aksuensis]